ncbi:MAG: hypothetical protein ACRCYS_15530, partial [Beijerinckiaceae bacterium]
MKFTFTFDNLKDPNLAIKSAAFNAGTLTVEFMERVAQSRAHAFSLIPAGSRIVAGRGTYSTAAAAVLRPFGKRVSPLYIDSESMSFRRLDGGALDALNNMGHGVRDAAHASTIRSAAKA